MLAFAPVTLSASWALCACAAYALSGEPHIVQVVAGAPKQVHHPLSRGPLT